MTDHEARARELVELIGAKATDAVAILTRVLREAEARGLEEVAKIADAWIKMFYGNSHSHAKGAQEIVDLCRVQAKRVREGA